MELCCHDPGCQQYTSGSDKLSQHHGSDYLLPDVDQYDHPEEKEWVGHQKIKSSPHCIHRMVVLDYIWQKPVATLMF